MLMAVASAQAQTIHSGPYAVKVTSNLVYGPARLSGSPQQGWVSGNTLDACLPERSHAEAATPSPAIVFVHGGAWRSGEKELDSAQCILWASYGVAGFTINYRLQANGSQHSGTPSPAQFVDTQLALRWIRANAGRFDISTNLIMGLGDSAGGALIEQVGYYQGGIYPSNGDPATKLYTGFSSHLNMLIPEFGPALFGPQPVTGVLVQSDCDEPSCGHTPDTMLVQGNRDTTVTPANSAAIYNMLHSHGRNVSEYMYSGGHEFGGASASTVYGTKLAEMRWGIGRFRAFGFTLSSP